MPDKITDIASTPGFRQFSKEVQGLLGDPLKTRGVHVVTRGGSLSPDGKILTLKLECSLLNDDGSIESREVLDFKAHHKAYNLEAEDLNRSFLYSGQPVKLIGIMPKRTRYPILVQKASGKRVLLPADVVARILGRPVPPAPPPAFRRRCEY